MEIAEKLGVSVMSVSMVIHRISVSDRIMKVGSEAISDDPLLVFPDYFFRKNRRKKAAWPRYSVNYKL